jgi:hypothetical protein
MRATREILESLGLPSSDAYDLPSSPLRFPDGGQFRIEIPSTEGPAALRAVVETASKYRVPVHRVSQGSGIMLLTDDEIREMLRIGRDNGMEVSLFVGPRSSYDIGAQVLTSAGKAIGAQHRGADQLAYALEDIGRGCDLGLRGILVADLGLLSVVRDLKSTGKLPADLVVKISVAMGPANPAAARVLEQLGAGTLNLPTDLTLPQLGSIRKVASVPIDLYVEVPDNFGGFIRHYEVPEMIRVLSPLYVKLGLRNAPDIYPSGSHIESTAVALSRERVRRARIALDMVNRYYPEARISEVGAADLGIPE